MVYSKASDEMKDFLSAQENIINECLQIDPDDDKNKIAQLSKELVSSDITKFNHGFAGLTIPDDTLPSSTPNTSAILTESTNVSSTTMKSSPQLTFIATKRVRNFLATLETLLVGCLSGRNASFQVGVKHLRLLLLETCISTPLMKIICCYMTLLRMLLNKLIYW